jgi:HTH-type transcriptional regulator/antitoxin HigA
MNTRAATPDRYLELVKRVPLRPIRDDATLEAATAMIDELLGLPELTSEEDDYLDVLGDLVEKYEEQAHPIPDAPAGDVLRYLMECRSLSQAELAKSVGMPSSVVSEVLAGKRALSKANITKLADYFGVKVDVFL